VLRLQYEMLLRGFSGKTMAIASDIPQPTFSLILGGRLKPLPTQLQRLSNFLKVPPEELMKDVDVVMSIVEKEQRV